MCPQKDSYKYAHSSFIHNSSNMEINHMSTNGNVMNKLCCIHTAKCNSDIFWKESNTDNKTTWIISKILYWAKEAQHKSVHNESFHFYEVLEQVKLGYCNTNLNKIVSGWRGHINIDLAMKNIFGKIKMFNVLIGDVFAYCVNNCHILLN